MTELDALDRLDSADPFEARFAAAYRRYLDEIPTAVDAGSVARAAAAQPRARGLALPWSLRPMPALAWLLILGILLAALGASAVFVASQRPALGLACAAGTNPNVPGPAGQARPTGPFADMTFDRRSGRVIAVAVGDSSVWQFDVCANTWTRMRPAPSRLGATSVAYDADAGVAVRVDNGTDSTWTYDAAADAWTQRSAVLAGEGRRLVEVPGLGVVSFVGEDLRDIWRYDARADAWRQIASRGAGRPDNLWFRLMAYDASARRVLAYGTCDLPEAGPCAAPAEWILLDPRTGAWSEPAGAAPPVYQDFHTSWHEMAYDESSGRTVVFSMGIRPYSVFAYHAPTDRWETLWTAAAPETPPPAAGPPSEPTGFLTGWMVYDSTNERLVVAGIEAAGSSTSNGGWMDAVWAFDANKRAWSLLLAASTP